MVEILGMSKAKTSDVLVISASNGENLQLAQRPIVIATFSGGGGMELLLSLRIQLTHLGAEVVGRQLLSNHAKPAKDESIQDLLQRLGQKQPIQ